MSDGIQGTSTVIAQAESSHYAFFRGKTDLVPEGPAAGQKPKPEASQKKASSLKQQLLEGVQMRNTFNQKEQVQQLDDLYEAPSQGVEAAKALK